MSSVSADLFFLISAIAVVAIVTAFYFWRQINLKEAEIEEVKNKYSMLFKDNYSLNIEVGHLESQIRNLEKRIEYIEVEDVENVA